MPAIMPDWYLFYEVVCHWSNYQENQTPYLSSFLSNFLLQWMESPLSKFLSSPVFSFYYIHVYISFMKYQMFHCNICKCAYHASVVQSFSWRLIIILINIPLFILNILLFILNIPVGLLNIQP
jgi:hypothetical protein